MDGELAAALEEAPAPTTSPTFDPTERFRCVPLACSLSRASCAARSKSARKLASTMRAGESRLMSHACSSCELGRAHVRREALAVWPDGTPLEIAPALGVAPPPVVMPRRVATTIPRVEGLLVPAHELLRKAASKKRRALSPATPATSSSPAPEAPEVASAPPDFPATPAKPKRRRPACSRRMKTGSSTTVHVPDGKPYRATIVRALPGGLYVVRDRRGSARVAERTWLR